MINYIKIFAIFFLLSQVNAQQVNKILQNKKYTFGNLTSENGFMQNSANVISQDSQGYLWFGTPNGLYKYDGYSFNVYRQDVKNPFSISQNDITSIFEDDSDFLWVGTPQELNILDKKTDKFYSHVIISESENSGPISRVKKIIQDKNGTIWIATNKGLFKTEKTEKFPESLSFKKVYPTGKVSQPINTLLEKQKGEIIIGKGNGLSIINTASSTGQDISSKIKNIEGLNTKTILCFVEDENQTLWVGTNKGLYKLIFDHASNTEKVTKIPTANYTGGIESIVKDNKQNLWMGTPRGGLIHYNKENKKVRRYNRETKNIERSIRSNSILDVFIDRSGVLWIATSRGGLSTLDLNKKNFIHYKQGNNKNNSINDNILNAFYEEESQDVWLGTFNGGLSKLSFKNGQSQYKTYKLRENSSEFESVFAICKDNEGYLWVGTFNNGLFKLELDSNNNIINKTNYTTSNTKGNLPTNKIHLLYKDILGDIWFGSFTDPAGLMKFTPSSDSKNLPKISSYQANRENNNSLTNNRIAAIFEDSKGVLWIGTKGGLTKILRSENNEPEYYKQYKYNKRDSNSLSNNNVFVIQEDSYGSLWIGTFGGGLNKLIKEEKEGVKKEYFELFDINNGLPDNAVYGILEDSDKNLWISTNNGLSKFSLEHHTFKNYNISDGIQNRNFRKFAYHKGLSGLMYFGGINGFNVFNPSEIKDHLTYPNTVITDLKIFNKSVGVSDTILGKEILSKSISYTDDIELKYSHNAFSFDFASLHFVSPEQNKYAYTLEGFDKDWNYTDSNRRFVSYSNLEPGDYTFKVKSSNNDNIWNEDPALIKINILPPIYRTWWMYTIYVLIIIGLMWLFRNFIVIRERFKSEITLQKFEQEKIREVNKMKLQFFTNVSHEFKTPLTLILGPLDKLIKSDQTNTSNKGLLVMMQRNANQLFNLIQQVLEFRKIENNEMKLTVSKLDIVKHCKELVASFNVLSEKKNIELIFNSSENELIDYFDFDKLNKIFNNLISNAVKYTPVDGQITFKLSTKKRNNSDIVEIEVADTGSGIPINKLPYIFKRFYQASNSKEADLMGSGVGLALTKALVQIHKGSILVNSQEQKGTKFIVRLPLGINYNDSELSKSNYFQDEVTTFNEEIDENLVLEVDTKEEDIKKEKPLLLIVEDNNDMRTFIKSLLIEDYKILEAVDGVEGKDIALNQVPDIIISDVMMPRMNGKDLCMELKNNEITSHIPIILLTAKASAENQITGFKIGADAYIPKPFNASILVVRVKNLLDSRALLRSKYKASTSEDDSNFGIDGINEYDKQFLEKAEDIIEQNLMNVDFSVNDLGSDLAYSRMQLYRKLKSITGLSANEFIRSYRLKKAADLLRHSNLNISEILYQVGFSNRSYFAKCFKLQYNKTPREYREN